MAWRKLPCRARVPVGPAVDGKVPMAGAPDAIRRTVWQLGPEQTVRNAERTIVEQLDRRGYEVIFDCIAQTCGGFDFRFGIDVVGEPQMRVDLRNFRFITARQAVSETPAYVTFLISRSPETVFVQLTEYHPVAAQKPVVEFATPNPEQEAVPTSALGAMVLEGLEFESGGAGISADPQNAVDDLAKLLTAEPDLRVLLVGHSDMSGSLDGNLAVSKARAEAVRAALINDYSIDAGRLTAHGVAFLAPRASNETEDGRQKNRRVEAVFSR